MYVTAICDEMYSVRKDLAVCCACGGKTRCRTSSVCGQDGSCTCVLASILEGVLCLTVKAALPSPGAIYLLED